MQPPPILNTPPPPNYRREEPKTKNILGLTILSVMVIGAVMLVNSFLRFTNGPSGLVVDGRSFTRGEVSNAQSEIERSFKDESDLKTFDFKSDVAKLLQSKKIEADIQSEAIGKTLDDYDLDKLLDRDFTKRVARDEIRSEHQKLANNLRASMEKHMQTSSEMMMIIEKLAESYETKAKVNAIVYDENQRNTKRRDSITRVLSTGQQMIEFYASHPALVYEKGVNLYSDENVKELDRLTSAFNKEIEAYNAVHSSQ
jgi:hypothetical protein